MEDLLENHIDAPIKKAVAGLALLGLTPVMSCCGFSYDGEVVPKTHLGKAYIYLTNNNELVAKQLRPSWYFPDRLLSIASMSGWSITALTEWIDGKRTFDFYADTWSKPHPWGEESAVHFYEKPLLAIVALNKSINSLKHEFLSEVLLEDGNSLYKKESSYWQYKPTKSWLITPEIWENLPS